MDDEKKKILIVEDDANFVTILTDGLRQSGFSNVSSAFDGEAGFKKALEEKPDLILLDLILPKMRGEDFLKKLRAHEELARVPVLIISQLEDYEKIAESMSLGIKGYLVKSDFSLETMIGQIRTILMEEEKGK